MPRGKVNTDDDDTVSSKLLDEIRKIVREEVDKSLDRKLKTIQDDIAAIKDRLTPIEKGLDFASQRLDDTVKVILPDLSSHMTQLAEGLAKQTLQLDVHSRKWNLVLHGLKGEAGEQESGTRAKCVEFARDVLRVPGASNAHISACHRLSRKEDAGIIVRFCDLAERDRWISGTKHLKNYTAARISLCPDLPPVVRPLKDTLMMKRRDLPPEEKARSRVNYLPYWPFVELKVGDTKHRPDTNISEVLTTILGFSPVFKITEPAT